MNVTNYPTYTTAGATSTQTSTPMYVDLLCDDISYHSASSTATPTATAIYSSSPTLVDLPTATSPDKVVMIPSSGVIVEQSYNRNPNATNSTNMNTNPTPTPTTQVSSYTYNSNYSNDTNHNNSYEQNQNEDRDGAFYQDGTMDPYQQQQQQPQQRYFKGRPVKAKNAHLPDEVLAFKQQRKIRTVAATCTGGVVGLVALGPLGGVLGATSAYAAAKTVGKHRERKITEHAMLQQLYQSSSIREAIATDDPTRTVSSTDIVPSSSPSSSYGNGVSSSSSYTERSIRQIPIPIERAEAA
jgi:hypothetical protein